MDKPLHGLDDPAQAAFAWRRFRRILGWMGLGSAVVSGLADLWLWWALGSLDWFTAIAVPFGTFLTLMASALLMGLMFLSSGSGHDEQVEEPLKGRIDIGD